METPLVHTSAPGALAAALLLVCVLVLCPPAADGLAGDGGADGAPEKTAEWPARLRVLTGPSGGQWFMMGDPIAAALTRHVLPASSRTGGGVTNIASVDQAQADVAFSLACFLGAAYSGEKEYENLRAPNTVLLMNVYPQVLYFLVRKDFAGQHRIGDVRDLLALRAPVRFASLKPGTASEFILRLLFKYGYDTSFEKLKEQGWALSFSNYAETADNFAAGDLDCFAYTAGTTVPLIHTVEKYAEVTVLPVEQNVLDILREKFKTYTYTIPPGVYASITHPVPTVGDFTCLVTRRDLPDDLVHAISGALWENKRNIASVIADFGGLSPETALPEGLPAHPGAAAFWREILLQESARP
jgi:TRAP transporter TAXI family solute receptor